MRIAAFARNLVAQPTGRGMVAREMLEAVRRIRPEAELHLFSGEDPGWPGVSWRPASGGNVIEDLWRVLAGIGRDTRVIRPDVFWSATHLLPYRLPPGLAKIVTLLDVVWRDHPETMSRRNRHLARSLERGLHQADRIVCISAFTRDRLRAHWPQLAERSVVLHLAPRQFTNNTPPASASRPYLLNVDTVEPRKNLSVLIDVVKQLTEYQLVQCGAIGWGMNEFLQQVKATPSVVLKGYVSETELVRWYRGAVAALFPSIYEGFHLPPLDAMSAGCPVIASDIPAHREVLGDAAIFVPCHDVKAWVEAVARLRNDRDYRADLVAAGLQQASRFSWDSSARTLLQLFEATV